MLQALLFFVFDPVNDSEQAGFDEPDQPFEHLRLAGEVAIERGFGAFEPGGERGGGDLFTFGCLQHRRQCLQDLQLSFARLCHLALPETWFSGCYSPACVCWIIVVRVAWVSRGPMRA